MGLTTESVHVAPEGVSSTEAERAICAALRRTVLEGPFEEVAGGEGERTLIVLRRGRWYSVFDSEFGSSDLIGKALSNAASVPALSMAVHDSDAMEMKLWSNGAVASHVKAGAGRRAKGALDPFVPLMGASGSIIALKNALDTGTVFAEDKIAGAAELLGLDVETCLSTAEDFLERGSDGIRLQFRSSVVRPVAAGLPDLRSAGNMGVREFGEGDVVSQIAGSVVNHGGELVGLRVTVSGGAIEDGLIEAKQVVATHFVVSGKKQQPVRYTAELGQNNTVEFPDLRIPGYVAPKLGLFSIFSMRSAMREAACSQIYLDVTGKALVAGQGDVRLRVSAMNGGGPLDTSTQLVVHRGSLRGIKMPEGIGSAALRELDHGSVLQGMVVFNGSAAEAAPLASVAIEEWCEFVASERPGDWFVSSSKGGLMAMPKMATVKGSEIGSSRKWRDRLAELPDLHTLDASLNEITRDGGAAWQCNSPFYMLGRAEHLPHVYLFADTRTVPAGEELLVKLVESMFVEGRAVQAYVAKWGASVPEMTTYDMASGVHGQCTTSRHWAENYVRGAAPRLWLGEALWAKLDAAALGAVGSITPLAHGRRFELGEGKTRTDLDQALAAVIGGAEEWRAAAGKLYGR
ncbi:MAG: hypothetical protein FJW32_15190 [Acidobacteria bacterium]|nr:hypothetical protein [Acidobacteriota bacterium]